MLDKEEIKEDEFEYNDGLGDLLREKDKREFSWAKTSIVLISLLAIIIIGLTFSFKFGLSFLTKKNTHIKPQETIDLKITKEEIEAAKKVKSSLTKEETTELINKAIYKQPNIKQKKAKPVSKTANKIKTKSGYRVIAGTFSKIKNAQNYKKELEAKNIDCFLWHLPKDNSTIYLIQCGAYDTKKPALQQIARLKALGIDAYLKKK